MLPRQRGHQKSESIVKTNIIDYSKEFALFARDSNFWHVFNEENPHVNVQTLIALQSACSNFRLGFQRDSEETVK